MNEKEKITAINISEAIHAMSDFEKGYFLGVAETRMATKKEQSNKSSNDHVMA